VDLLIRALSDPDPEVVAAAAYALEKGRTTQALPELQRIAGGPADPRGVVLFCYARLAGRSASPALATALAVPPKPAAGDWTRAALASWAAGELGLDALSGRIAAVAARPDVPRAVKECALQSIAWFNGAPRPRTFLTLRSWTHVAVPGPVAPGGTVRSTVLQLDPTRPEPNGSHSAHLEIGGRVYGYESGQCAALSLRGGEAWLHAPSDSVHRGASDEHVGVARFTVSP
jgi:hypothetical protein